MIKQIVAAFLILVAAPAMSGCRDLRRPIAACAALMWDGAECDGKVSGMSSRAT